MKLYEKGKSYTLYEGDMRDMLQVIDKDSVDCIICDPPYGLTSITKRFGGENSAVNQLTKGFMGKTWDGSGVEYDNKTWKCCFDVLKDGGYLLAFGGSRTFHRIACAIEDAGFEIRDTIMWLYGSGFPKSMNIGLSLDKKNGCPDRGHRIATANRFHPDGTLEPNGDNLPPYQAKTELGKKWESWGTCLKPSYEPIIIARKPFNGSLVDNIIKNGVGGLNIDECRIPTTDRWVVPAHRGKEVADGYQRKNKSMFVDKLGNVTNELGRFPANTILTYDDTDFNEVCGGMPNTKSTYNANNSHETEIHRENAETLKYGYKERIDASSYNDEGSASRYFYCAKASKKDRDEGLEEFEEKQVGSINDANDSREILDDVSSRFRTIKRNTHPTVKPTELMQYLVRLVAPPNATILDPFMGSGSTGKAVMCENVERNKNYQFIGIEMTDEYLPIAKARIEYASNDKNIYKQETKVVDVDGKEAEQLALF